MMSEATVIIVDDDRSFVEAVALYLEKHGYHARMGFSGREGLDLLRNSEADVAVIDVHMPDMSGLELAAAVRSRTSTPAVILISGDDSVETAAQCQSAGVHCFMPKPLAPRELLRVITQAVEQRN